MPCWCCQSQGEACSSEDPHKRSLTLVTTWMCDGYDGDDGGDDGDDDDDDDDGDGDDGDPEGGGFLISTTIVVLV